MPGIFHEDGCVIANIPTKDYRVNLKGKCQHTKIRSASIVISAQSAESARNYVATYLNIPQNVITTITEIAPIPSTETRSPNEPSR